MKSQSDLLARTDWLGRGERGGFGEGSGEVCMFWCVAAGGEGGKKTVAGRMPDFGLNLWEV